MSLFAPDAEAVLPQLLMEHAFGYVPMEEEADEEDAKEEANIPMEAEG